APLPLGFFILFGGVVFLLTAGEGCVRAFFNIYLDQQLRLPTAPIGLIYGVGLMLPVLVAVAAPKMLQRWGSARVLAVSGAAAGLLTLPLALIAHWLAATLGFMGLSSMVAINVPSRNIFSQEAVA